MAFDCWARSCISSRSIPAQKAGPLAESTTSRVEAIGSHAGHGRRELRDERARKGVPLGGRFSVIEATPSATPV